MKKQLLVSLAILSFLLIATTIVVLYGRGYRFWFEKGRPDISGTGLLVTTSKPDGAQVFINDHLTTATNSTINLSPGEYIVRVYKDGYFPWQKKVVMQKEVVIKIQATLFATAPKLESITTLGVGNPTIDPSRTKLAYAVASGSARKNGLYVLDLTTRPLLTIQSSSTQIADDSIDIFSKSLTSWSPDGRELISSVSALLDRTTAYLLDATSFNQSPRDVTPTLPTILSQWETEKQEKETARRGAVKSELKNFIDENFSILEWSPDETKILYTASESATLPVIIKPPLIGANQTKEEREIKKDAIYVYDIKEDKNFKVSSLDCHPELVSGSQAKQDSDLRQNDTKCIFSWLSDSLHLVFVKDKKIHVIEYDNQNDTTIYAGPFFENYVFPSLNESKVVILTDLGNPDIPPNLYMLGLQ